MATNRHETTAGTANHVPKQCEVADGLDIVDAMGMVRNSHSPTEDNVFRSSITISDFVNVIYRQSAFRRNFVPRYAVEPRFQFRPPSAMIVEKLLIVRTDLNDALRDTGEHRQVAADVGLDVKRGNSA